MSGLRATPGAGDSSRASVTVSVTVRPHAVDIKAVLSRNERMNLCRILSFSLTSNFGKIYSEPIKNHIIGFRVSSRQQLKLLS